MSNLSCWILPSSQVGNTSALITDNSIHTVWLTHLSIWLDIIWLVFFLPWLHVLVLAVAPVWYVLLQPPPPALLLLHSLIHVFSFIKPIHITALFYFWKTPAYIDWMKSALQEQMHLNYNPLHAGIKVALLGISATEIKGTYCISEGGGENP